MILYGCPQSRMPNPIKGLLEVCEDTVEVLLVLEIFLTKDSQLEDVVCGAPSCSETCRFFSDDILRLRLQSVHYGLQHDFALTDEAERSLILPLLQVAYGLGPQGLPLSCLLGPVLLGYCQPQLTSLSFMIVLQPPHLCEGWGGRPLYLSGDSSVLMDLHFLRDCTAQSSILSIGSLSLVLLKGIFLNGLG